MKKLFITAMMVLASVVSFAQNYDTLYIADYNGETVNYCTDSNDGVIVYGRPECPQNEFHVNGESIYEDFVVIINNGEPQNVIVSLTACATFYACVINYTTSTITNPFDAPFVWKRTGEAIELYAPGNVEWSTGETENEISVTEPGTYSVTITDACGSETYPIRVRNNVELFRATVDLETNLNKATWQVTEEQAEYINEVKVYRDGLLVGTAPYQDGYFLDAIGSDNAARNYQIVGVSVEGEDCPIASYQKGTIHTTYYEDVNGNLNMTWNVPYVENGANGTLTYFQICKYDPATGDLTVVDQVNAAITDYTCGVNQFDGGQAVIAAVFSEGKGVEELSFSNLTTDILGVGENDERAFNIYPNPAKDRVTIEGTGMTIITNTLGQTILTREINGKETIELPQGLYFVKMNGVTQKIVVE